MRADISVKKVFENLSGIRRAMAALTERDVFVGIPRDETAREQSGGTGINNAYLGYIHEFGVPEKNIPARPFLLPGIKGIQADAAELLKGAAKRSLEGNEGAVETALNKIGLLGKNAVGARFVDNDWQPLSDKTLDAREVISETVNKKGKTVKKYSKSKREKGRINPLIDTGQLRKSITYVIRKKDNQSLVVK